ncbi:MAG: helix-turn-helix domain-containing protein [Lachnospiraceae bacterium]|nr:helix-turn-helix domain-containing protein [Lachnospiraceae bacterium]
MKKFDGEPSFQGMLEVFQLVMDGMNYFCRKFGLTRSQADVILALCIYGEATLKELCEYVDFPKSTASRIVEELVARKMLDRTIPPDNRRTIKISVNKRFRKKMESINQSPELQAALTKKMSQEEGIFEIGKLMMMRNIQKETTNQKLKKKTDK